MLMQNTTPPEPQNPDPQRPDKDFQTLLQDYAAPIEDNGFSQTVLQNIDIIALQKTLAKRTKYRLYSLYGAGFLGGILTATQIPSLGKLFEQTFAAMPKTNIESTHFNPANLSLIELDPTFIGLAIMGGLALWAMIDSKISDIF